jgi:hypothetical protein
MGPYKFFNEQNYRAHRGSLFWYGGQPVPLRVVDQGTQPPLYRPEEADDHYMVVNDFYCKLFDMGNTEDRDEYIEVMDRIANDWYILIRRDQKWPDGHDYPIWYVEWCQRYGMMTEASLSRQYGNAVTHRSQRTSIVRADAS